MLVEEFIAELAIDASWIATAVLTNAENVSLINARINGAIRKGFDKACSGHYNGQHYSELADLTKLIFVRGSTSRRESAYCFCEVYNDRRIKLFAAFLPFRRCVLLSRVCYGHRNSV